MDEKKKILTPEAYEQHERNQRALLERIRFHEQRAAQRAAARPKRPKT
jgi:hypothetical protein